MSHENQIDIAGDPQVRINNPEVITKTRKPRKLKSRVPHSKQLQAFDEYLLDPTVEKRRQLAEVCDLTEQTLFSVAVLFFRVAPLVSTRVGN